MRNRAYLIVALLGLLTFALAPGYAAAAVQGQNLTEIALASDAAARATAVSATIDVAPLAADLGIVNVGASASTVFVITNNGGSDLNISGVTSDNASFSVVSFPATVGSGGGTGNLTVSFNPTTGTNQSGVITINSNASNGMAFGVNVTGSGNVGPTLAGIGDKAAPAFLALNFSAVGSDAGDEVDDVLSYSVAPALPPGATFNTNSGAFSWTPGAADVGVYTLTFCVSDSRLQDCETIDITVTADNDPPVADAGGPYIGGPGQNIVFNGTGSSDPDGDGLTYAWDFGDGGTGSGATPTHAYALVNGYLVTLTVTDDGAPNLSATDLASVQILNSLPATVAVKLAGSSMKVGGGGSQLIGVELNTRPVTDVDAATIKLSTTYPGAGSVPQISALLKGSSTGDIDHDNVPDMDVYFSRSDLGLLLGNVPNNTVVTLVATAFTTTAAGGIPITGSTQVKVKTTGPGAVSAFASPNPFNPATSVAYTLKKGGVVSVRIYSLDGRLVKTLMDGAAEAGTHEVLWDGRDNGGSPVRSGMYFVKTTSGGESAIFKLALVK
jgi:hypothetical protein